jgi:hypothetical protein
MNTLVEIKERVMEEKTSYEDEAHRIREELALLYMQCEKLTYRDFQLAEKNQVSDKCRDWVDYYVCMPCNWQKVDKSSVIESIKRRLRYLAYTLGIK